MRSIIKQVLKEEVDSKSERVKSIVNKYGIERAIKLVAGGKDTIKQAYQDNPLEFLDQFNDLKPKEINDKIYYIDKDNLPLFFYKYNGRNGFVYINYDRIWMFFEVVIGLESYKIKYIIKNWLEDTYNLKGLTPKFGFGLNIPLLENT
jgi:hypothetical protein